MISDSRRVVSCLVTPNLIHEQFGDGIMSAINFRMDVAQVVVTLDGKFLPCQW